MPTPDRKSCARFQYALTRAVLVLSIVLPGAAPAAEFFGPTPYTSAADTPAGFASGTMAIEDFEDASIDPRFTVTGSIQLIGPGGLTDSVDADDGTVDGSGTNGRSLFGNAMRIDFTAPFPTAAAMVWTDGSNVTQTFEAFGSDGQSLGVVGPVALGDASVQGTTGEDRFFGVREPDGISAIRFLDNNLTEIDHVQFSAGAFVEPAILATADDGDLGVLLRDPASWLPSPAQTVFALPLGAYPHGAAFLDGDSVLFADLDQALLYRSQLSDPDTVQTIALAGRSSGNGTLAAAPDGRFALSIGMTANGSAGESVVLDFAAEPPTITPISPTLKVMSFVSDAVDFAPDGRAFVCHANGVSVLSPPYTTVDFTMTFPLLAQSGSFCALSPDGSRLFVTRVLSETQALPNGVRTAEAPFSAGSVFTLMPAPSDVQGLGPMVLAPDGQALLLGQQFLFPPAFAGTKARAFVLRAPFDGTTAYAEIALPASTTGPDCVDGATTGFDCPGFEHIEVGADGNLAILTGNSAAMVDGFADAVPAVFVQAPFDDLVRSAHAVQVAPATVVPGRGTGAVRFQPQRIFRDRFEGS